MGKMQRSKGARVERELVNLLRSQGYDAKRVPLSGATEFAKHDVVVQHKDETVAIEVKSRNNGFASLYELYYAYTREKGAPMSVFTGDTFVSMSDTFGDMLSDHIQYFPVSSWEGAKKHRRAVKRFPTLHALADGAAVLAIKDNRKNFLFVRF